MQTALSFCGRYAILPLRVQWNLQLWTHLGPNLLSFCREVVLINFHVKALLDCLLRDVEALLEWNLQHVEAIEIERGLLYSEVIKYYGAGGIPTSVLTERCPLFRGHLIH